MLILVMSATFQPKVITGESVSASKLRDLWPFIVIVGAAAADVTRPTVRAIDRRIPILIVLSSLKVGHHPTPTHRCRSEPRSLRAKCRGLRGYRRRRVRT